jgi:hypothetical protein
MSRLSLTPEMPEQKMLNAFFLELRGIFGISFI